MDVVDGEHGQFGGRSSLWMATASMVRSPGSRPAGWWTTSAALAASIAQRVVGGEAQIRQGGEDDYLAVLAVDWFPCLEWSVW